MFKAKSSSVIGPSKELTKEIVEKSPKAKKSLFMKKKDKKHGKR